MSEVVSGEWGQRMRLRIQVVCLSLVVLATCCAAAGDAAPLADAVEKQDRAVAGRLLNGRTDVNAAQPDGMTALHWAAHHDDIALVRQLLDAGADVKTANRYGVTPL